MRELEVLWAGKYYQTWDTQEHSHSFFQLVVVEKGCCLLIQDGIAQEFSEHGIMLFAPQETHAIHRCPDSRSPLLLDLKFTVADEEISHDLLALGSRVHISDFPTLLQLFSSIYQESHATKPYYYNCICYYLGLILTMLLRDQSQYLPAATCSPALPKPIGTYAGVNTDALVLYINNNYANPISLDDLAALASISKSTLIQAFKAVFGTTPIRYINTLRLDKAKELLIRTDSSVGAISELVGFQSLHYFSRYFKNNEGISPVEYRLRYSKSHFYTYSSQPENLDESSN